MMNDDFILRRIDETCDALEVESLPDGTLTPLNINGVKGRISVTNSPLINVVGLASLSVDNCRDTIHAVLDRYRKENKAFGWLVGPTTTPANLGDYLMKEGFKKVSELCMSGMVLRDLKPKKKAKDEFQIKAVEWTEFGKNISLITHAFGLGMDDDVARLVMSLYKASGRNSSMYFAYDHESRMPVAFAARVMDRENHLVYLLGAGTLPEYRGKGIYSSLVAKRLNDSYDEGARTAIIQAVKQTSAPICEKLGFKPVCDIDFYMPDL